MNSEEVAKKIADLVADNVQLTQISEMLDNENKRLKHNMQLVSRNSYMRGWNEATKKMRNFITKHMLDYWKEEYENHN
jgi:hypothetical protein